MTTDEQARRIVLAVSETARTGLHAGRLSPRALSDLYLRIRDRLGEHGVERTLETLADDLALTVYLSWLAEDDPPRPSLLVALKSSVERALDKPAEGE